MDKILGFGALLVYVSLSAPAFAQAYDGLPIQANSTNCRAVAGQANIDGSMQQIIGRATSDRLQILSRCPNVRPAVRVNDPTWP
ncbi:hypothetical protein [Paraburkholderia sp. BR13439]|uniref:hypothetical protein n=1 Tax=Paraburkholderia sp. BR13439 TaxID=3236996 RepID=UPI0034CD7269